jgi:hypothetical protein
MGAGHDGHLRPFPTLVTSAPSARIILVVIMLSADEGPGDQEGPERTESNHSGRSTRGVDFRDPPARKSPVVQFPHLFRHIFRLVISLSARTCALLRLVDRNVLLVRIEHRHRHRSPHPSRGRQYCETGGRKGRSRPTVGLLRGAVHTPTPCPSHHATPRHAPGWISTRRPLRELPRPAPAEGRASR